ncbi:DUF397 domain-containing protein [Kitasatospora kifunensis]|uniref:DUF397 domain-containing protein n=1 Tax=Kitasatospora kifunensis TaxID=58351 RepID=A0A7W7R503_KITKI|nr:DUF397 domain-containing protein [Kitasatospora kifunensis]MBB4925567.1 hypothetical protein [Kitasatospora kifunensis]
MHFDLNVQWIKSSHSGGGGNCVEVAPSLPHVVPVRDSKDPSGPALLLSPTAFATFVAAVKHGDLGAS